MLYWPMSASRETRVSDTRAVWRIWAILVASIVRDLSAHVQPLLGSRRR